MAESDDTRPTSAADTVPLDAPSAPMTDAPPAAPRRRRRRAVTVIVTLVVLAALLVVAAFVGEAYARQYATDRVKSEIVRVLELPSDDGVDVDLGRGSILLQAARGSIDTVAVDVASLTLGDLTGSARLTATGVPIDSSKPVGSLRILAAVPASQVDSLRSFVSGADIGALTLEKGLIRATSEFRVLALTVPVSLGVTPSAKDGALAFTPADITVGQKKFTAKELRAGIFGGLAASLLSTREVCIAQYLPSALTLTDVAVDTDGLQLTLTGDRVALGGPELATRGTCG